MIDLTVAGTKVPNALLPKIGRVAVRHLYLDAELDQNIWQLLNLNRARGQAITGSIRTMKARLDLFHSLALIKYPKDKERLRLILKFVHCANADRNSLIHDHVVDLSKDRRRFKTSKGCWFSKPSLDDLVDRLKFSEDTLWRFRRDAGPWRTAKIPGDKLSPTERMKRRKDNLNTRRERRKREEERKGIVPAIHRV